MNFRTHLTKGAIDFFDHLIAGMPQDQGLLFEHMLTALAKKAYVAGVIVGTKLLDEDQRKKAH